MNRTIRSLRRNTLTALVHASFPCMLMVSLADAATCTLNSNTDDPADASAKVTAVPPNPWNGGNASVVTLRDCIVAANLMTGSTGAPNGTMTIDASAIAGRVITLQDNLPLLFNNTTINAGSGIPVTVNGGHSYRIFFVSGLPPIPGSGTPGPDGSQPTSVSLSNLILQNGSATGGTGGAGGMGAGGALFANKTASVVLTDVSFTGNSAQGGSGGAYAYGGGGMGAGVTNHGGGGLNGPSSRRAGAGIGTLGTVTNLPGGFGGVGLGQISAAQNFNPSFFDVDAGSGTSGGLIGGGGSATTAAGFGGGGYAYGGTQTAGGFGGGSRFTGGFGGGSSGSFGGFGGGGGIGGVGGGSGDTINSGGGAGFGGAVFVRNGGTLTVQSTNSGSITSCSVAAGSGSNNGAAAGSGLFIMTGATTVFDIAGRYTISDVIADDSQFSLPNGNGYTPGNGAGAAITKQGAGTLILSGANTYAGTTTVSAGTLGGNGSIINDVTLASGAQIAPGDPAINGGAGTLSIGPLTWNGGGVIAFQLGATAADSDLLTVIGPMIKGTAGTFKFHFGMGDKPPVAGTYTLIQAFSTFNATDFSYDFDNTYVTLDGSFSNGGCGAGSSCVTFIVNSVTSDRIFANGFD